MILKDDEDLQEKEGAEAYKQFEECVSLVLRGVSLSVPCE